MIRRDPVAGASAPSLISAGVRPGAPAARSQGGVAMKRRILVGWALALACAGTALSGCELLRHEGRTKSDDPPRATEAEDDPVGAVKSDAPKGFFHSTRLPG